MTIVGDPTALESATAERAPSNPDDNRPPIPTSRKALPPSADLRSAPVGLPPLRSLRSLRVGSKPASHPISQPNRRRTRVRDTGWLSGHDPLDAEASAHFAILDGLQAANRRRLTAEHGL
ncbi:MAG TPA: hypothetical protein VG184_04965 [Acidimicrobiales bacterium]|nr:hypothetical protein [Acidimicrobiales bacterium]